MRGHAGSERSSQCRLLLLDFTCGLAHGGLDRLVGSGVGGNLGFARANNLGIRATNTDLVLLLLTGLANALAAVAVALELVRDAETVVARIPLGVSVGIHLVGVGEERAVVRAPDIDPPK